MSRLLGGTLHSDPGWYRSKPTPDRRQPRCPYLRLLITPGSPRYPVSIVVIPCRGSRGSQWRCRHVKQCALPLVIASHRPSRCSPSGQELQQLRQRRDLIALSINIYCPGRYPHRQDHAPTTVLILSHPLRAAQRLAVEGDDLPAALLPHTTSPAGEEFEERRGGNRREHVAEGVVAGDPVGQFRNPRNQSSRSSPKASISVNSEAPQKMVQSAMARTSSILWSFPCARLGSSISDRRLTRSHLSGGWVSAIRNKYTNFPAGPVIL